MSRPERALPTAPMPTFGIGELARRTGRSIHAIRWYESLGLMPGVRRDGGNRRVYTELHVGWLDLLHRLRTTGMTIAKLREYAALAVRGRATLAERHDLLRRHRDDVQSTIAEWRRSLALLDRKIDFYGDWIATGQRPALEASLTPRKKGKRP